MGEARIRQPACRGLAAKRDRFHSQRILAVAWPDRSTHARCVFQPSKPFRFLFYSIVNSNALIKINEWILLVKKRRAFLGTMTWSSSRGGCCLSRSSMDFPLRSAVSICSMPHAFNTKDAKATPIAQTSNRTGNQEQSGMTTTITGPSGRVLAQTGLSQAKT